MRVLSQKKQLSLADVANHADVAVVAETLDNITGGALVEAKPEPRIVVLVEDLLKRLLDRKLEVKA